MYNSLYELDHGIVICLIKSCVLHLTSIESVALQNQA